MLPLLAMGALKAAPYVLNALGGIFGKKKKYVDPEELRQRYGAGAITADAQKLSNYILSSPYGQDMLKQAATSGQEAQTNLAQQAAMSGQSPDSGASSGASDFAAATAPQIQSNLEGQAKGQIWQQALGVAAKSNQEMMPYGAQMLYGNQAARNAEPSMFQKIAAAAGKFTKKPGEQDNSDEGGNG